MARTCNTRPGPSTVQQHVIAIESEHVTFRNGQYLDHHFTLNIFLIYPKNDCRSRNPLLLTTPVEFLQKNFSECTASECDVRQLRDAGARWTGAMRARRKEVSVVL